MELYTIEILSGGPDIFEAKILGKSNLETSYMSSIVVQLNAAKKIKVNKVQPEEMVIVEALDQLHRAQIVSILGNKMYLQGIVSVFSSYHMAN